MLESKEWAGIFCFFLSFFFCSSHMTHQAILQCLSHLLDFILTIWRLQHVLIKNDFGRKWYVIYESRGAACKLLVSGREKRMGEGRLSVA